MCLQSESQGMCGRMILQVGLYASACLHSVVFILQGGIYLFVHKHVGWDICVIYDTASICPWPRPCACAGWVSIHIVARLHSGPHCAVACDRLTASCVSVPADAAHIGRGRRPTVCGLIWHGMIQAITHTEAATRTHHKHADTPPPTPLPSLTSVLIKHSDREAYMPVEHKRHPHLQKDRKKNIKKNCV